MSVELPILGLLQERPMHGYELRRAMERIVGSSWTVSWGALYPMLRRLEEQGLVTKTAEPAERGQERLVYHLTPAGERRLQEALSSPELPTGAAGRHTFLLKLAFFHLLAPAQRRRILAAYRAAQQRQLDDLLAEHARPREHLTRYRQALLDYGVTRLQADLAWLDSLAAQEEREALTPPAGEGGTC